jgi:hypothetical protein
MTQTKTPTFTYEYYPTMEEIRKFIQEDDRWDKEEITGGDGE